MTKTLHGKVRGKTIELDEDLGVPEGQEVRVTVEALPPSGPEPIPPGEGLRRAFRSWGADAEDLDKFLKWNREQRNGPPQCLQSSRRTLIYNAERY